jgi:cytidylate kinase
MSLIIAIDGYSCCGKSTLSKDLADRLNLIHIDSGAMYRAVTLYFIRHNIDLLDSNSIDLALKNIKIEFRRINSKNHTILNGEDVESQIRTPEVSKLVSPVSTISKVRKFLVASQKEFAKSGGLVMDGRDIGTVVVPEADLKLFLTSEISIRTHRRMSEIGDNTDWTFEQLRKNLEIRDHIDSTREESPLRKAEDAVEIDTSFLTREEQLQKVIELLEKKTILI